MKYSKQERLEIGRKICEGEYTKTQAAELYGISFETARSYAALYRSTGSTPSTTTAAASVSAAATDDLEQMSRDELIRELVRYRVNEARSKKGYTVKGVGAAKRYVPIASRSIR